jgi:hypothetical protein
MLEKKKRKRNERLSDWCPKGALDIVNEGIHNLTDPKYGICGVKRVLTQTESIILSFGPSFIPIPKPVKDEKVIEACDKYANSVRGVYNKYHKVAISGRMSDLDRLLRVGTYAYPRASDPIEKYLDTVKSKLLNKSVDSAVCDSFQNRNFHRKIVSVCKSFLNDKDVIVKASDKNLGLCVVPRVWYVNQVLALLNDTKNYEFVQCVPQTCDVFNGLRLMLKSRGVAVNAKVSAYLFDVGKKTEDDLISLAAFYLLIKVHKIPIGVRPIASCFGTVSRNASRYVHFVLCPVSNKIKSILRNSLDLMRHCALVYFPANCVLLSADVVNLYPQIPVEEGVQFVGEAIDDYNAKLLEGEVRVDRELICALLFWVLTNNYVEFDGQCWKQIQGTAMGTPCAVVYANLYLHIVEKRTLKKMEEEMLFFGVVFLLYVRYIDDIFAVCPSVEFAETFVRVFNSISPTIKLTHEIVSNISARKNLPFLDVEISKGLLFKRCGLLDICLYQKPMNAYLFIPVFSNHSPRVFSSIIVSELRRFTLCCTDVSELERVRGLYATRLAARGYPSELICECFKSVFVRDEILFPLKVRQAYLSRTAMRPPFNSVMFPFDPPRVSSKKRRCDVITFAVDNTPRYDDVFLSDVLNYDRSGGDVMSELDFIKSDRQGPRVRKNNTTKLGQLVLKSRYVAPK